MNETLSELQELDVAGGEPDFRGVFPTLIDAYQNHSYEAGYTRGSADVANRDFGIDAGVLPSEEGAGGRRTEAD